MAMGAESGEAADKTTAELLPPVDSNAQTAADNIEQAAADSAEQASIAPAGQSAAPDLRIRIAELAVFLLAIIGALGFGLGVTDYLADHPYIAAYLLAYAGFRIADLLVREEYGAEPERSTSLSRQIINQLPLLLLFFAAPFERTYLYGSEPHRWLGQLGLLIGLVGLWIALGARIQLAFFASDTSGRRVLVQSGFYRFIRHPIFAGVELSLLGWPVIYGAWIVLVLTLIVGALVAWYRIGPEETRLNAEFGAEYGEYQRRSDRLIPRLW